MRETPYDTEAVLQELIEDHPQMLAGDDASHGPLILVRREAGVSDEEDAGARWSLDHLYLDGSGVPTLVEVKRSSDTRSRREVVAQMLDYASNAQVSFSAELMSGWLEESAKQQGTTAAETLKEAFGIDDIDSFWQTVDTNLKAERFRLVFVADSIGPELRRIIEFLNRQMSATEVLAIEVKQYVDDDGSHQTIVPRVVGDTSEARAAKGPSHRRERLDREALLAKLRDHNEASADAARAILDWADGEARVTTRYTTTAGVIEADARSLLWLLASDDRWLGHLEVSVETLTAQGGPWKDEDRVTRLLRDLADVGVDDTADPRYLTAPLESLAEPARQEQFFKLMEGTLDTLTASP